MTGFDTNILVYACDKSDPVRQAKAMTLISTASDGVLLWQVACEFVAVSRKLSSQGFTAAHAWDRLADYLRLFPLILPTAGLLDRAHHLHVSQRLSFWDAMIVSACLETGIERLYSEDLPGRQVESLQIINPFA